MTLFSLPLKVEAIAPFLIAWSNARDRPSLPETERGDRPINALRSPYPQ
jgi:hypothetical protein